MLWKLLTAPVMLPVNSLHFIVQRLMDQIEQEQDPERQLKLLELDYEQGHIDKATYTQREASLLRDLRLRDQ